MWDTRERRCLASVEDGGGWGLRGNLSAAVGMTLTFEWHQGLHLPCVCREKRHLSPKEYVEGAGSSGQWAGVVESKAREGVRCLCGGLG